ncbi:MAG: WXG100 family type VII secretion target [Lachnospiraceae bacterium]|nr:WXG100 family type VII secretion target [Lachnospiraceae bacterium]
MARSLSAIRMDFSKAKRQAGELETVAGNLKNLSEKKLEGTLNDLAAHWTGDNSVKYIGKGQQLAGNINKTANALDDVAQAIRDIAEVIYEAEMEAWERAHDRD